MRLGAAAVGIALLTSCGVETAAPAPPVDARREALGEPMDGFPSWHERVVHVWTNRARADPAADLAPCASSGTCAEAACYSPRPPLVWNHGLGRAARFHSANLQMGGCGLQHDSPCNLHPDIATRYTPGPCNGDPSCACASGFSCGSVGTPTFTRIGYFASGGSGENIAAGLTDPRATFYLWLHERDTNSTCMFRIANGHRWNILGGSRAIGVGRSAAVYTQDFGSSGTPDGIVSGVHYPQTGASIEFRANWYRGSAPETAQVNVGGTCQPMTLERGSGTNGTYLATVGGLSGCVRYYFQFRSGGADVLYPSTGAYGIGCPTDWEATRPALCGVSCTPMCSGRSCGDDGCGGSCGSCPAGRTCNASGACVCSSGTDCGGSCVNTMTDAAHCGRCGNVCPAGQPCVGGTCTCTPACSGRMCGPDGCGGSCGTCPGGQTCNAMGRCVSSCTPMCSGRECGTDGCGGSCGTCPSGQSCNTSGTCVCIPNCVGRACGDDGCGGSCGTCPADRICNATGGCDCSAATEDCAGACTDTRVDPANCGSCGMACAAGESCIAGACIPPSVDAGMICVPACDGRECGGDSCGGSCGTCTAPLVCAAGGSCVCPDGEPSCTPDAGPRPDGGPGFDGGPTPRPDAAVDRRSLRGTFRWDDPGASCSCEAPGASPTRMPAAPLLAIGGAVLLLARLSGGRSRRALRAGGDPRR